MVAVGQNETMQIETFNYTTTADRIELMVGQNETLQIETFNYTTTASRNELMVGLNVHRDHSHSLLGTGKTGTDRVNLNLGDLGTIHQEDPSPIVQSSEVV